MKIIARPFRVAALVLACIAALVCVFVSIGIGIGSNDIEEGRAAAARDLAERKLGVAVEEGEPAIYALTNLLRERYGIEVMIYTLPASPTRARKWVEGYNSIMRREIERRFGSNVVEAARAEAARK
jgi:hypothetical protein